MKDNEKWENVNQNMPMIVVILTRVVPIESHGCQLSIDTKIVANEAI